MKIPAPLKKLRKEGWIEPVKVLNNRFIVYKTLKSVGWPKKWNEIKALLKNMGFKYSTMRGCWFCDVDKVKDTF